MRRNPILASSARRIALRWLAVLPAALLPSQLWATPGRRPTPADDWGPFYPPDWRGEIDADLTRFAGRSAGGRRLRLSGQLVDTSGKALPNAVVEIWQADARGRYRHPGVPEHLRDDAFQGYGRTEADADGRYVFQTIVPGRYGSRPPHIHLRVAQPGLPELVTQLYFRGDNREAGSGFAPPEREQLTVDLLTDRDGGFRARFDMVLAGA